VLPAPLGPSKPKISPWCTSRSSSSTAFRPPGYTFVSFSVRITTSSAGTGHLLLMVEVRVDPGQRAAENLGVALGQDAAELVVELVHDLAQLREPSKPGVGDDDPEDTSVGGIGAALHQPLFGQLVEVADEGGRLDAHELGELALAGVVGVGGLVEEQPVPEAGAVLVQAA